MEDNIVHKYEEKKFKITIEIPIIKTEENINIIKDIINIFNEEMLLQLNT